MIGNEIRDHTLVQQVFAEDPACMAAAFAAVDVLARAFGEHSVGVVIEPFVNPERSHVPTRLFVMAKTRLASAEADALLTSASNEWQKLEHVACNRVTLRRADVDAPAWPRLDPPDRAVVDVWIAGTLREQPTDEVLSLVMHALGPDVPRLQSLLAALKQSRHSSHRRSELDEET